MANELFLDIRFLANEGDLKSIESKLSDLEAKTEKAKRGGDTVKTVQSQAKAERELSRELRANVRLNEELFRRGEQSQKQALENVSALERQAKAMGVVNQETARGKQNFSTLGNSQRRLEKGFTGIAQESATANRSLVNLGRVVQDLPFGFLGISNNISPALESFDELKEKSGGVGGAFNQLLGSLKGSGGIIFALGSLLPTAVLVAQRGFNFYAKQTEEADEALQSLNDTTRSFINESARLRVGESGFLNIFEIEEQIKSTQRIIDVFSEDMERLDDLMGRVGTLGVNARSIQLAESQLSSLREEFNLTDEDVENVVKSLEEFNSQLRTSRALASLDTFAIYRDEVNQAVESQTLLVDVGLESVSTLETLRDSYASQAQALRETGLQTEDARERYVFLVEIYRELSTSIEEYTGELAVNADESEDNAKSQKKINDQLERRNTLLNLLRNQPDEEFDDTDSPQAQRQVQSQLALTKMLEEETINSLNGLNQKIARITVESERKVTEIRERFGDEANKLVKAQRREAQRQIEQAVTDEVEKAEEKRKNLRQQAVQTSLQLAGSFVSSLIQLNQAQTDETEAQARKKFETQKKLTTAQAVINGLGAIVKTYNEWGFPAGIPFAAAQAAVTATQIAAIQRTSFNDAGFNSDGGKQSGFFETDAPNRTRPSTDRPIRPQNNQPINISLEGEFDDEMVSVKAERGKEKRLRGAIFTV